MQNSLVGYLILVFIKALFGCTQHQSNAMVGWDWAIAGPNGNEILCQKDSQCVLVFDWFGKSALGY